MGTLQPNATMTNVRVRKMTLQLNLTPYEQTIFSLIHSIVFLSSFVRSTDLFVRWLCAFNAPPHKSGSTHTQCIPNTSYKL